MHYLRFNSKLITAIDRLNIFLRARGSQFQGYCMLGRQFFQFGWMAAALLMMGSTAAPFAHAGNIRCMPKMMGFAVQAFELARSGAGVIAADPVTEKLVNLGQSVTVRAIEIVDINKDSYRLRFNIENVNVQASAMSLDTSIFSVNYEHCTIYSNLEQQLRNPGYRILFRPR